MAKRKRTDNAGIQDSGNVTKSVSFVTNMYWVKNLVVVYSLGHMVFNAFKYGDGNALIFIAAIVGMISVEIVFWHAFEGFKNSQAIGSLSKPTVVVGGIALLFISAGVLGGHNGWSFYFNYILPVAPLVMIASIVWLMMSDPIRRMNAKEKESRALIRIEKRLETIQVARRKLEVRRAINRVKQINFTRKIDRAIRYATGFWRRTDIKADAVRLYSYADELINAEVTEVTNRIKARENKRLSAGSGGDDMMRGKQTPPRNINWQGNGHGVPGLRKK